MQIAPASTESEVGGAGTVALQLPFRAPLSARHLFAHLAATAVPGVEEWTGAAYRRTLRLPHGHGVVSLSPRTDHIACRLDLADLRDLSTATARCRRLLDLDADPGAVDEALAADPGLAPAIAAAPGQRIPRTVDEAEFALRCVLGQQVSTAAARTHAGRLVAHVGDALAVPDGSLTHLWPTPVAVAEAGRDALALPERRRQCLTRLAAALAAGDVELGPGTDRQLARRQLAAMPGLGPWTVESICMRALGDPDAFLAGDLGVRLAASALGLHGSPAALTAHAERWRPWRSYAVQYLWSTGDHAINRLPGDTNGLNQ